MGDNLGPGLVCDKVPVVGKCSYGPTLVVAAVCIVVVLSAITVLSVSIDRVSVRVKVIVLVCGCIGSTSALPMGGLSDTKVA